MATFAVLSTDIFDELSDAGLVYYTQPDVTAAMQDAYNIVVALSQCIVKKVTLNHQDNLTYYDFTDNINWTNIFVSDFMAVTAIFNNATNLWLLDDKTLKDFDRDRIDWENWTGQPVWWAPCNDGRKIALVPKLITATGNFDLYYYATAPTISLNNSPQFPRDFHGLIKYWSMFSLLADAQEYKKSEIWWNEFWGTTSGEQHFEKAIYGLASRAKNLAKSDLLMLG